MAYPLKPRLPRSSQTPSSTEQLESALAGLNEHDESEVTGTSDAQGWSTSIWCGSHVPEGAMSRRGKRQQMTKMIMLILSPILMLLPVSLYFIADNIKQKTESDRVRDIVMLSTELGRLIHVIQKERDMSVLYLSSIGPETKSFLNFRYLDTDEELAALSDWPVDLDFQRRDYFTTKRALQRHLTRHRNELIATDTIYKEVDFYADVIGVFIRWMYDSITESKFGVIWKVLVTYQKIVIAKEELSLERALGTAYFSQGRFIQDAVYVLYNRKHHNYKAAITQALRYAPNIAAEYKEEFDLIVALQNDSSVHIKAISRFRRLIQLRSIDLPSLRNATRFYDNMSYVLDQHLLVQQAMAVKILAKLNQRAVDMTTGVVVSAVVVCVVLLMCPILIRMVQRLTDNIQSFALTLADKTKELNREKKRTDSLLYQMLPRPVAEQLKKRKDVNAEFFREVTVFFSDIVGFTRLTGEISPLEVVNMLNDIYTLFDERIGLYDVYKVETIGDSYMVASGLPHRNGNKHASEIANLSLDLLATCAEVDMPLMPGRRLRIRIGLHSGQCVAGVVGLKLPRYCLFGDTINTASRMETNGMPNRIHCSAITHKLLNRTGSYIFQCRGNIEIKGKGIMMTYFLLGSSDSRNQRQSDSSLEESQRTNMVSDGLAHKTSQAHLKIAPTAEQSGSSTEPLKQDPIPEKKEADTNGESQTDHKKQGPAERTDDGPSARKESEPIASTSQSGMITTTTSYQPPPSYQELEHEYKMHDGEYPPIFKVIEGYHF